jgi:hypothetical protein
MHSAKYLQIFIWDSSQNIGTAVSSEASVYFHQTTRSSRPRRWSYSRSPMCDLGTQCYTVFPCVRQQLCYNEIKFIYCSYIQWGMLQRTMLQRTQMLQQTRRNTICRRSTHVFMTCRAFPLSLERQSSSLLLFVRFIYQFSSVICSV